MASESRQGELGSESDVAVDQVQNAISVAPLNSAPYIGPPMPSSASSSPNVTHTATNGAGSAMIFIPPHSPVEEWENLTASTKTGFRVTGSAAMGQVGQAVGLVDIGICEDSYLFCVSLPGVARDEHFSFDVDPSGKVLIKGVTITGARVVCRNSQVFRMLTQNLCPPGPFTISFQLPGPVDNHQFSGDFKNNGILEGRVKKM